MYDYLIVGAGLYAAVFARTVTDAGKRCLVLEKRDHIGGNLYTEEIGGIPVHCYGAHIFHTSDSEIWSFVNRFAEFRPYVNTVKANFRGKQYSLPFNMNTFRELWGITSPADAKEHLEALIRPDYKSVPKNLEEQAMNLVGRELYETLVKGYTEKQWGRRCTELPPFIIRRLPIRFTFDNNYFNDPFQGIPENGYTPFAEQLFSGIEVKTGTDFLKHRRKWRAMAHRIVFTGPIDAYFDYSLGKLAYRSLRFETEDLPVSDYQGFAVVNETAREVPYTRTIEHRFFSGLSLNHTVITREYPAAYTGENEPYYPVNDAENNDLYERYCRLAEREPRVQFGGRLGTYSYLDMDKVVALALRDAKRSLEAD